MVCRLRRLKCNGGKFGGIGTQQKVVHGQYLVDQLLTVVLLCTLDYLQYDFDMAVASQKKFLADTIRFILKNVCWINEWKRVNTAKKAKASVGVAKPTERPSMT